MILLEIFIILVIFKLGYSNYLARKRLKNQNILFKYCDLRRELMALARDKKISVDSEIFKFLYKFLSKFIHYIRDYKFLTKLFLDAVEEDQKSIENAKYKHELLEEDAKKQCEEACNLLDKFFKVTIEAIMVSDIFLLAKWNLIKFKKLRKIQRVQRAEKVQELYDDLLKWNNESKLIA